MNGVIRHDPLLWLSRPGRVGVYEPSARCFTRRSRALRLGLCGGLAAAALSALPLQVRACDQTPMVREATVAEIVQFVRSQRRSVLTFEGYSGAGYEDPAAMLKQASRVLSHHNPRKTLVNAGATAQGIGAVYELAKDKGFSTMGIVSSLARDERVELSPCVDFVFYVRDATWGGRLANSNLLSPTSAAIVESSNVFIGIGGGEIARDEMLAARRAGRSISFVPADMNHQVAREKARKQGGAEPTAFRGAAHSEFGSGM